MSKEEKEEVKYPRTQRTTAEYTNGCKRSDKK